VQRNSIENLSTAFILDVSYVTTAVRQVALWMTEVRSGDIIIIRHTYENCPYVPTKLKTLSSNGGYKPVYALLRVVQPPAAAIVGTKTFGPTYDGLLIAGEPWADVEPIGLGFIDDLEEDTRKYLAGIIQPTIARLAGKCKPSHKADLLRTATIGIDPGDFPGFA
jgi:hypothetical protein